MSTKRCTRCHKDLPTSEYYVNNRNKDGLCRRCKGCYAEYYQANKKKRLAYGREYYAEHREELAARKRRHNIQQLGNIARLKQDRDALLAACRRAAGTLAAASNVAVMQNDVTLAEGEVIVDLSWLHNIRVDLRHAIAQAERTEL